MCRWLVYSGPPIFMEELLFKANHCLVEQALHSHEAKVPTNGDGFGVAWYRDRSAAGLYREVLPAWNDCNLKYLSHQIKSHHFFAHVRASTGTATSRDNCHPFAKDRWVFMHNGQLGRYQQLRRKVEGLVPDSLYGYRRGTTDSEVIFLMILGFIENDGLTPKEALAKSLQNLCELQAREGMAASLRATFALSNGEDCFILRYATDPRAPSLYLSGYKGGLLVLSEPLDEEESIWQPVECDQILHLKGCDIVSKTQLSSLL